MGQAHPARGLPDTPMGVADEDMPASKRTRTVGALSVCSEELQAGPCGEGEDEIDLAVDAIDASSAELLADPQEV